jgi:hypothetical protein
MRGLPVGVRQLCRESSPFGVDEDTRWCAQTPLAGEIEGNFSARLDCRAAMLQAISIGREIPMLEPWIINEIRRREEERRRGDLPRLEIPMLPEPDEDQAGWDKQGDQSPERGVVIIGM